MQITLWVLFLVLLLELVLQYLTWKPLNNFLLYFFSEVKN
jgi:hypothetical protein